MIDGGISIESGTPSATDQDNDNNVYEAPLGDSNIVDPPRPRAGDGMDNSSGAGGGFGGAIDDGFRDPIEKTPRTRRDGRGREDRGGGGIAPPADNGGFGGFEGSGGSDPADDLFKVNKPVQESPDASDVPPPPSGKAPATPPEARRSTPEVITTVSLTGNLGRDGQLNRTRMSFASAKNKKTRRMLRWISVPNNGRTALR